MSETLSALLLALSALVSSISGGITALNTMPTQSQVAQVASSGNGVQFTLNTKGLQTLTYNGQSFLVGVTGNGPMLTNATFRTPAGVDKPYGWATNTLGHGDFSFSAASTTAGADYFQHIYHPGKVDSVTVKMKFTPTDSRTVKVTIDVTNNDPVNTLKSFNLNYFLKLTLPAAANNYQNNIPIVLGVYGQNAKPAQLWSGTWGSVAMWPDNYNTSTWFNMWYQNAGQTTFDPIIANAASEPVLPGQTWHYSFNVRFSATTDSITTLAPEAFTAVRNSFPYLLNWPDRRPIARAFIAEGTKRSALNPRGYLNDPLLDVSSTTLFRKKMLEAADRTLANMNSMNPKPQGLMIWDLEGQEFNHAFTYVGYPSKIADMAPEMDRIADEYLKRFTDAGYKIGMTLRPSEFGSGPTLPSTCQSNSNYELADKFILTTASYPNRSYFCASTNAWSQQGLGLQVTLTKDADILENLRSKVTYARNRWGAKIFYVDSTVYPGGTPINFEIWRTLQKEFPDTLFFPENEASMYFGSSAPFNQANMGVFETFSGAKNIYPQAFSVIQATDGVNYADPATYNRALAAIKAGNIYMVDGWYASPQNTQILKVYRDAAAGVAPLPVTTPPTPIPIAPVVTQTPPQTPITPTTPQTPVYTPPTVPVSNAAIELVLLGNNPAYIQKGTQYSDPGVFVKGSVDYLFKIKANVNGKEVGTVNEIQLDMQTLGTSTIMYSVTDSQGKSATATRTVLVYADGTYVPRYPVPQTTLPSSVTLTRTLSLGAEGNDVIGLQQFLIAKGYLSSTSVLGTFGPATKEAVKKYQCEVLGICTGAEATTGYGMVGLKTRALINASGGSGSGASSLTTLIPISPSSSSEENRIRALMEQIASLLKLIDQLRAQIAGMKR